MFKIKLLTIKCNRFIRQFKFNRVVSAMLVLVRLVLL